MVIHRPLLYDSEHWARSHESKQQDMESTLQKHHRTHATRAVAIDHSKWISDIPAWRMKTEVTNSLSCRAPHFKVYMKHFGAIPTGKQKERLTPRRASEFVGGTYEPFSNRVETPSRPERSLNWATASESDGRLNQAVPGELYRGTKRRMMRVKEDAARPPPEQTLRFPTVDMIMPPPVVPRKSLARDSDADSTPIYVVSKPDVSDVYLAGDEQQQHNELDTSNGGDGEAGTTQSEGDPAAGVNGEAPFTGLYDLESGLHYLDYTRRMPGGRPKSMWTYARQGV